MKILAKLELWLPKISLHCKMQNFIQGFTHQRRLASVTVFWHQNVKNLAGRGKSAMPTLSDDSELLQWSKFVVIEAFDLVTPKRHDVIVCGLYMAVSTWCLFRQRGGKVQAPHLGIGRRVVWLFGWDRSVCGEGAMIICDMRMLETKD
jgi:hypothetical protein